MVDEPDIVPAAPVVSDMEYLGAEYLGTSPREADITDPRHRLFLELSNSALEDAGYDPRCFDGSIGGHGGSGLDTYRWCTVE